MKNVIATWSGGKDSCLAAYKAIQSGYNVSYLANTVSKEYGRVRFHGLSAAFIQKQAAATHIPLLQEVTTAENYRDEFKKNLSKGFLNNDIEGVVFGDIHLADCLEWANGICHDLGVETIEPLWHLKQEMILKKFIDAGFEAIVVSTQASLLGQEWLGRQIDSKFFSDIKKLKDIDACGENGEYHSAVTNGPLFRQRIKIQNAAPLLRDGYWFLNIKKSKLI